MQKLLYFGTILLLSGAHCGPPLQLKSLSGLYEDDDVDTRTVHRQLNGVRLPRHVYPLHYDLEIRPIINAAMDDPIQFTAPGKVAIRLRCDNSSNSITLHSSEIQISPNVTLRSVTGTDFTLIEFTEDPSTSTVKMTFNGAMTAGQEYDLTMSFVALVGDGLDGLYRSSYIDSAGSRRWLATTQFQKLGARKAFPCFDEPNFRSTFNISVGHHMNYKTLSNSPLLRTEPMIGIVNWRWDIYGETVNMPTYLIAIIVSDFIDVTAPQELSDYTVKTWGPLSMTNAASGEFSARAAAQILSYFETYYDYKYQFPKLDSVAIPDFAAGAMENWALNTYRTVLMLWYDGESTQFEQWRQAAVIAHEISHHWFGDLVTCDWWNDLWLNEGFARYMQFLGASSALKDHGVMDRYTLDVIQIALENDAGVNTEPVHSIVKDQVVNQNSRIVYEKGAALIRMMQSFLTEDTLIKGLRAYLKKYEYSNTVQDQLFEELQTQAVIDGTAATFSVKEIMDSWTLKSGFPLIRISRATQTLVYVSQEKWVNMDQRNNNPEDEDELWYVPINYATKSNPDFSPTNWRPKFWLDKYTLATTRSFGPTDEWIVVNADARNYYRVLYDNHFTSMIQGQLIADHNVFSLSTRSQLIDDHFQSAFQGYTNIETALEMTRYLDKEIENTVWTTVLNNMRQPYRYMQENVALPLLKEYLVAKVESVLDTIGWEQTDTDLPVTIILRAQLLDWASTLGSTKLTTTATTYAELLANEGKLIPADIQPAMYCKGIELADVMLTWDPSFDIRKHLLDSYNNATRVERYTVFLNALACETDPTQVDKLIADALAENPFTVTHSIQLLQKLAENVANREKIFDMLPLNMIVLVTNFGQSSLSSIFSTLTTYTTDEAVFPVIRGFITTALSLVNETSVINSLTASWNRLDSNKVWADTFGQRIATWLTPPTP